MENAIAIPLLSIDARSSRESNKQRLVRRVFLEDGTEYDMLPGGRLRPLPNVRTMKLDQKELTVDAKYGDAKQLRDAVTKYLKRNSIDPANALIEIAGKIVHTKTPPPVVVIPIEFGTTDSLRAVAKIACTFLASYQRLAFLRAEFDGVRKFVDTGDGDPADFLQPFAFDSRPQPESLDHFVRISQEADGNVIGIVGLLGAITFMVQLGRIELGVIETSAYRVDQLKLRSQRNHAVDVAMTVPSSAQLWSRDWDLVLADLARSAERSCRSVVRAQHELWSKTFSERFADLSQRERHLIEQAPDDEARAEIVRRWYDIADRT